MSALTALNQALQSVYEAGDTTYCRSSSRAFSSAGVAILGRIAARAGLPFNPECIPIHDLQAAGAHEAQRPTEAAMGKVVDLLPVDTALLSDEEFVLAELGRQGLLCGTEIQVDLPDVRHLPDWARGLPWERVTAASACSYPARPEPGVYTYETDEIAFRHLVSFGLGKPSTLVGHANRFAMRKLYHPHTGLTHKGQRWLDLTPAILRMVETSLAMEAIFDESVREDDERIAIERALACLGEESQRYITQRLEGQAVFSLLNGVPENSRQQQSPPAPENENKNSEGKTTKQQTDKARAVDADRTPDSMPMGM